MSPSPIIKTYKSKNYKKPKNKTKKTRLLKGGNESVYQKDDFNASDGMLVTVWGPSMWHFLHTMSFNYPVEPTDDDKKHYRDFILSLQHVLPCKYCRINLKSNFQRLPLEMCHMKNRETFSKYVYELHELINTMLKKKSGLKYCDVRERYEHFRARCTEEKPILFKFKKSVKKREKGCTEPLYGKKSKCIIKIVPQDTKGSTFQMDSKCIKKRM
jgi:hypothetical protein